MLAPPAVPEPSIPSGKLSAMARAGAAGRPCAGRQATLDGCFAPLAALNAAAGGAPAVRNAPDAAQTPGGVLSHGSNAPAGQAAASGGLGQGLGPAGCHAAGEGLPSSGPLAARDTNALASGVFAGQAAAAEACSALHPSAKRPQRDSSALSDSAVDSRAKRLHAESRFQRL